MKIDLHDTCAVYGGGRGSAFGSFSAFGGYPLYLGYIMSTFVGRGGGGNHQCIRGVPQQ